MKLVFATILILWGVQLLLESFFGFYIPFFRLLIPIFIILWGFSLLSRSDWGIGNFSFFSGISVQSRQDIFFLDRLKHNQFFINDSHCIFDGTQGCNQKTIDLWIVAKKSRIIIQYNRNIHTIVNLSLHRSSVHCSAQSLDNITFEENSTVHLGKTDLRPTIFYHIKAKDTVVEISEK